MSPKLPDRIEYFESGREFRKWLAKNHDRATEIWVGFWKKSENRGITYQEALDEALCWGWIDGVRKSVDAKRYTNRFSPRKPNSIWSQVNIKRAEELIAEKRMAPPGLAAFEARKASQMHRYSYEQAGSPLDPELERIFRKNRKAWKFFEAQSSSYQRVMRWYVMSAKRPETRLKRLERLIEESANGRRVT